MTDVFTSDAVIEDMQNVLSQLMNVSSAIMSMAYSLGNASVQLEDISDTDDDDEALCLIAQCANTASITFPRRLNWMLRSLTERISSTFPPR